MSKNLNYKMLLNDSHIAFVNLDHRTDRRGHMNYQLGKAGIEAERVRGLLPSEVDVDPQKVAVMQNRTPGAIGCHYSQVSIMEKALLLGKHAWVMEDDLIFCEDFTTDRIIYIDQWMNYNDWDVFWLGGTFHSPAWWHKPGHDRELPQCKCTLGKDVEPPGEKYRHIVRTYGAFCTYAYIVNINSLEKILKLLNENVHLSMGIDWLFIYLQPQLKTYAFVPGCIKQMDGQSDIGKGMTIFSGFSKLNGTEENSRYWWQNRMEDFDPLSYEWK